MVGGKKHLGKYAPSKWWRGFPAFWIALAGACVWELQPSLLASSEPRSVILISVDTLRADRLSCYGHQGRRTPHIDSITQGGTLFSAINAQVPLTLPSHASLLTSTYPFANGLEDNGQQLGSGAVTLAKVLKSQGCRTAAFVGGFVLDRRFGLHQGFDVYDSPFDLRRHRGKDPGDIKRLGEDVVRSAQQWLEQNGSERFFLFLHLYDLHTPYDLPPATRARFPGPGYEAELGYVDEVLGSFWEFLGVRGLLNKALVVFTSDHGESLGDHGESTHGYFIYQSTLWVPLIMHWPRDSASFPARVDEPASLLDVGPTILQFLKVPRPAEFQGRSLLPLVSRKAGPAAEEIYSESLYGRNHFGVSALRSLRVGRYKYIEAPRPELYDLAQDPGEGRNLYARRKSLALSLRERLLSMRSRFRKTGIAGSGALSPEVVARLSSLGYVALSRPRSESSELGPDPKDRIVEYEKYGRAIVLASSGRLKEANSLLESLLDKDPKLLDVRLSLGLNQQKLSLHLEAMMNFQQALKEDPLNVLAHFNLAVSYFELQKLDDAIKECEAVLAIAPYYTRAEELLGTIRLKRKEYEKARNHFAHLLTVAPGDYTAHYNLGVLAAMDSRWDEGARHVRAALAADPESAEAHNTLGSIYLRQGDTERAREEFSQAVRLEPKFAWAHYNLGLVYRQQNKRDEAAREFRQALTADPEFQAARAALESLERAQK